MNETHCSKCCYFFGKEGIHCAVHPYGKESHYCSDWQQKEQNLQQDKLMNANIKTKFFSYSKMARYLLVPGAALLIGHQLFQNVPPAIRAEKDYKIYATKCETFLERASQAGTTGVASDELARGINWLEVNYSTESFEYRDLKGNLDYLEKQPENLAIPVTIRDSIKSNTENIRKEQLKLRDEGRPGLGSLTDFIMFIFVLPLICLLILILIAMVMEGSGL
jgi:hypothetical protein